MPGVDNFAHAGGFIGGYATSVFFNPLTRERGDHMLIAAACLVATFLAIVDLGAEEHRALLLTSPPSTGGHRSLIRQLLVDDALERVEWLGAAQRTTVDEERRRPVHPDRVAGGEVRFHFRLIGACVDAGVERRRVQTEVGGMLLQVGLAELRRRC